MLGSVSEADDAVQEAWLRLHRADPEGINDLEGWLITVVARVCLDQLRRRRSRHEGPLEGHVPEPILSRQDDLHPEQAALIGDGVGLALLVVLDTLTPSERLAFVLHDVFGVPFSEIAPLVERSPAATRQAASRARRRVREAQTPDPDLGRQRAVVDAFFAAARGGDFDALLALLDPDVVVRTDFGVLPGGRRQVHGAQAVAEQTLTFAQFARFAQPALVNGAVGVVAFENDKRYAVMGFTVRDGQIVEIDILADPDRLQHLDMSDWNV
jgi:RNA polymerase sigma-70 factor (ECF subfamily)